MIINKALSFQQAKISNLKFLHIFAKSIVMPWWVFETNVYDIYFVIMNRVLFFFLVQSFGFSKINNPESLYFPLFFLLI